MSAPRPNPDGLSLDALVERLYDSVDDAAGLSVILPDVAAWVGDRSGVRAQSLVIAMESGEVLEDRHCGLDPARFAEFTSHWMAQDPRMALARARPGVILSDAADLDRAAFERSAIFNEALVPDDSVFSLFGAFPVTDGIVLAQAFIRGRRDGPFEPTHVERMRAILPHLGRATRLRCLLREAQGAQDDLRLALNALPTPVALLDGTGRVLTLNAAGEQLIEASGVVLRRGRLCPESSREARELTAAIARVALLSTARPGRGTAKLLPAQVSISRRDRAPLWVLVCPLRPRSSLRDASHTARVLAVFHDPEGRARLPEELLATIHGLTPTEAQLASALAAGQSLAEFADARGCTEQTARTHLKRVFGKTQTRGQVDLVRVLLSSAALHATQPGVSRP